MAYQKISRSGLCTAYVRMLAGCLPAYHIHARVVQRGGILIRLDQIVLIHTATPRPFSSGLTMLLLDVDLRSNSITWAFSTLHIDSALIGFN
jgi:hypothetical protein